MKRNLSIDKGSSLTWTGDVTNPQINLTTLYSVNTSPQPIILPQMTGASRSRTHGTARIWISMFICTSPGITHAAVYQFRDQATGQRRDANIEARLSQLNNNESELNKQVFSLLLFNSFFEESP